MKAIGEDVGEGVMSHGQGYVTRFLREHGSTKGHQITDFPLRHLGQLPSALQERVIPLMPLMQSQLLKETRDQMIRTVLCFDALIETIGCIAENCVQDYFGKPQESKKCKDIAKIMGEKQKQCASTKRHLSALQEQALGTAELVRAFCTPSLYVRCHWLSLVLSHLGSQKWKVVEIHVPPCLSKQKRPRTHSSPYTTHSSLLAHSGAWSEWFCILPFSRCWNKLTYADLLLCVSPYRCQACSGCS